MRRFLALVFASLLVFVCCAPSFSADFVEYPVQNPENPYAPAPLSFETPSLLYYYYYPDQTARPDLYVYGGAYWGLTGTNTWEHSAHGGEDYVTWATYRINYQLYLNDDTSSTTPWKMSRVRLQVASPLSDTEVRVAGFSDNVNVAVQGVLDGNSKLSIDVYPVDTLFVPQNSGVRMSFWIDFAVMFDPSVPASDLVVASASAAPVLPIMDAAGFEPRLVSYIPADSMGGSSAAGQQQIDQSINAQGNKVNQSVNTQGNKINQSVNQQTQQQEQQYNEFTGGGTDSAFVTVGDALGETMGLFDAVESIYQNIWGVFHETPGYAIVTFPSFSLNVDGVPYEVWPEYTFDFNTLNNEWGLGPLKTAVNFACVFAVYAALLRYLTLVYDTIIGRFHIYAGNYF